MKKFIVFGRFVDDEKDNITFTIVHDSVLDMKKSCRERFYLSETLHRIRLQSFS